MTEKKKVLPWTSLSGPYDDIAPEKRDDVIADEYRRTFSTPHGVRVLADIMGMAEMFNATISRDRSVRDMIDGKRELAMCIWERAGLKGGTLALALIADDARVALINVKENGHERNADTDDRGGGEPLYPVAGDDDPAILTD